MFPKFLQGVVGIPGFLNHFNVRFVFEKPPHAVPDKRVLVDNQATNFRSAKGAANELILHNHSWGQRKFTNGDAARQESSRSIQLRCVRLFYKS
jgi:hypothetical protein